MDSTLYIKHALPKQLRNAATVNASFSSISIGAEAIYVSANRRVWSAPWVRAPYLARL